MLTPAMQSVEIAGFRLPLGVESERSVGRSIVPRTLRTGGTLFKYILPLFH